MRFTKPPLTYDEQIELLQARGLHVTDLGKAKEYLAHINYYRLRGYLVPFEQTRNTHGFRAGSSFDDVLNLYVFDRELRLLIMDAIERVEVSLRAAWAYHLAHEHGSHAHMNSAIFDRRFWKNGISRLADEAVKSREVFIIHYLKTYSVPQLPPLWSVCEIMSLGTLSFWYKALKPQRTRSFIADVYELNESVLQSVLHHLTYVRNLCAHHSRVWNRQLTVTMSLPRTGPQQLVEALNLNAERRLYNSMVMLGWMTEVVSPDSTWKRRLLHHIERYAADTVAMGFPHDFKKRTFWK